MTPIVSVIIPAYNAERFLAAAIDSVLSQQGPLELIVVNDGSTDGTAQVIAGYGDRIVSVTLPQSGLGAARNAGLRQARGDYVAFLDADDLWMADKLTLQRAAMQRSPAPDMLFCHCVEFVDGVPDAAARASPTPGVSACGLLTRRSLFDAVGPFTEERGVGEFLDWYSRARAMGKSVLVLDEVLFHRRVHGENMTRAAERHRERYLDVIRTHLSRMRAHDQS